MLGPPLHYPRDRPTPGVSLSYWRTTWSVVLTWTLLESLAGFLADYLVEITDPTVVLTWTFLAGLLVVCLAVITGPTEYHLLGCTALQGSSLGASAKRLMNLALSGSSLALPATAKILQACRRVSSLH